MVKVISWEDFEEKFKPIKNHIDSASALNGWMFETYGEEYRFIQAASKESAGKVWSFIDDDDAGVAIVSGLKESSECIGYVLTEISVCEPAIVVESKDELI